MKPILPMAALGVALAALLSGCAQTVALEPAADAVNPVCASIVVALDDVIDLPLRETNAQGTAAWGDPTSVLLFCGAPVPDPTSSLPCVLAGDVYWLRDGTDAPTYTFTTYGRDPAIQVVIEQKDGVSPGVVLYELQNAVDLSPETSQCTEIEDSLGADIDTSTTTPTPEPSPSASLPE